MACIWFKGLLIVLLSVFLSSIHAGPFYQGCFLENSTNSWIGPAVTSQYEQPFGCIKSCLNKGSNFAAIQRNGTLCLCGSQLQLSGRVNRSACNARCDSGLECGSAEHKSIYTTAVPIVTSVVFISQSAEILTNSTLNLTADIAISRPSNEATDLNTVHGRNLSFANIVLTWKVRDIAINTSIHELEGRNLTNTLSVTLNRPGMVHICLQAKNLLSDVENCLPIEVLSRVNGLYLVDAIPRQNAYYGQNTSMVLVNDVAKIKVSISSGSKVTFSYNFGDGTPQTNTPVNNEQFSIESVCITFQHQYKKCGNYTVSVSVMNSLTRQKLTFPPRFVVQEQDFSISPTPRKFFGSQNEEVILSVDVEKGCLLRYHWTFGDGPSETTSEPKVTHRYPSIRKYTASVTVFNSFKNITQSKAVYIEPSLTNVSLLIENEGLPYVLETKKRYRLRAQVAPQNSNPEAREFIWHIQYNDGLVQNKPGSQHTRDTTFNSAGRYRVTVTVYNGISNVTSSPLSVEAQKRIGKVSLRSSGKVEFGKETIYQAVVVGGSHLKSRWDFGDGQSCITNATNVTHMYTRPSKYIVNVMVYNHLNHKNASLTVYVTKVASCELGIEIAGEENIQIRRSSKLYLEALAWLKCQSRNQLVYSWKVSTAPKIGSEEVARTIPLRGVNLTEPILVILPSLLPYGDLQFIVKVRIADTVLEATSTKKVQVVKNDLVAVIKGGTIRVVGYKSKENITLDGSGSYDPDYPEDNHNLSFHWNSQDPHGRSDGFNPLLNTSTLSMTSPILTFPAHLVQTNIEALNITLTVSKRGRVKKKDALQMLRLVNAEPHLLTINCKQCSDGRVNSNKQLVVRGACISCDSPNITYEWRLYLVRKTYEGIKLESKCISPPTQSSKITQATTSASNQPRPTNRPITNRPITVHPTGHPTGYPSRRPTTGSSHIPTTRPSARRPTVERGNICRRKLAQPTTIVPTTRCRFFTQSPGLGNSFRRFGCITLPSAGPGTPQHPISTRGWGSAGGLGTNRPTGSIPRFPSQRPAASATPSDDSSASTPTPTTPRPTTQPGSTSSTPRPTGTSGSLYDPSYVVQQPPSIHNIFNTNRYVMKLLSHETTTGIQSPNLVMEKGKLLSGFRYMLGFVAKDAKDEEHQKRGMASIFFEVNTKPRQGSCTVSPSTGVEMDTVFTVRCQDWRDENQPIGYQVSYHTDDEEESPKNLLYTGYNEHISILLPAGRHQHGFQVYVSVSVFNSKGSSVNLCPIPVVVKPIPFNDTASTEEILYNKTVGSELKFLQNTGQDQKARQLLTIAAKILNSLEAVKRTSSKHSLRASTRTAMLRWIGDLTIRDKSSAIQSGDALDAITSVSSELNNESLLLASGVIRKIGSEIIHQSTDEMDSLDDGDIHLIARVASNLFKGSADLMDSEPANDTAPQSERRRFWRDVHRTVLDVVNEALKLRTIHIVLGESPTEVNLPIVSLLAKQTATVSSASISLGNVTFRLPADMDNILKAPESAENCFGTMATVYDRNPYVWSAAQQFQHHSKVASLALSTCDGTNIEVKNLKEDIEVVLPLVDTYKRAYKDDTHSLEWDHLNIHTIAVNKTSNQSLHLNLDIQSKLVTGFVVQLLLGTGVNNTLQDFRILNATSGTSIDVFLSQKDFGNVSSLVEIGVRLKNADSSRIKKVHSVNPVNYSLGSHWIGCYYWRDTEEAWFGDGCRTTDKTSNHLVHCRCNHLTVFSGAVSLAPNPLRIEDLRKISKFRENPVTLALVLCLGALYLILLPFCVRADRQDKRKRRIVHIANGPSRSPKRYKISVETGHWFNSGTTASVVIVLNGENHSSDPIELSSHSKPVFQRGSKDVFIVSSPESLSPVWKIHIWHYNEGTSPSWFLNRVIVKDLQTQEKWNFDCYRWLAVDEEDGQVDVEILATTGNRVNRCTKFFHKCTSGLTDYHMWLSVLGRPSYSHFTRAQRLSCCWSLLLGYLCVNAAWYRVNDQSPEVLGFLDITMETVMVGLVSGLVALLPNLLWIALFRYAKPPRYAAAKKELSFRMNEAVTESTLLPGASFFGEEDTLSILDQSIETLLHLRRIGAKTTWQHSYMMTGSSLDSILEGFTGSERSLLFTGDKASLEVERSKAAEKPIVVQMVPPSPTSTSDESPNTGPTASCCRRFSHGCVYVAWTGCILTALAAGLITIWYGLSFGKEKSIRWLQSLCISLLESFLISQPIAVVMVPLYFLCTHIRQRKVSPVQATEDDDMDEGFEDMPVTPFGFTNRSVEDTSDRLKMSLAVRQHQRYLKFLRPPKKAILYDAFVKRLREQTVRDYILEFSVTCVFLVVLGFLISGLWCPCVYNTNQTITRTLTRNVHGSPEDTVSKWWADNHANVLEVLYWSPSTNKDKSNHHPPKIFFQGSQHILIGKPRISQCRSLSRKVCINGTSGLEITSLEAVNASDKLCWFECDIKQPLTCSTVELSRTRSAAEDTISQLAAAQWITDCTHHLGIQFTLFAPYVNMSSTVSMEVNAPMAGKLSVQVQVHSFQSNFRATPYDMFLKFCKVVFVLCYCCLVHHVITTLCKTKQTFFRHFWNFLELFLVAVSGLSLVVYVQWSLSLYAFYREVWTDLDDDVFLAAESVYSDQQVLLHLYAIILFVVIIKSFHVLRIVTIVSRLGAILTIASRHIFGLLVLTLLYIFAFAHPGYLLFGRLHTAFNTFSAAFLSIGGGLRFPGVEVLRDGIHDGFPVLGTLYVALYLAGFIVMVRGLSAAIVRWSYHCSRRKQDCDTAKILQDYLMNLLYSLKVSKKTEEMDSDEDDEEDEEEEDVQKIVPVEYAVDEVETQMEELLFRMENLVGAGNLESNQFTYSTEFVSSEEGDVEYLYCRDDDQYIGSGYESDQSLQTYPSRRTSKDTMLDRRSPEYGRPPPDDVFSDDSWSSLPRAPNIVASRSSRCSEEEGLWMHPAPVKSFIEDKTLPTGQRLHVERGSEGLSSSSGHSMSRRRSDPTKEPPKPKHYHPLTRKPKIRPGQSFLDEENTRLSDEILEIPDETRQGTEERKLNKAAKRRNHRRGLGILPVTAVSPVDMDFNQPMVREAFANHDAEDPPVVDVGSAQGTATYRGLEDPPDYVLVGQAWEETNPRSPLHGIIGGISMNDVPQSSVGGTSRRSSHDLNSIEGKRI